VSSLFDAIEQNVMEQITNFKTEEEFHRVCNGGKRKKKDKYLLRLVLIQPFFTR
jgi:hypothetical protein